MVTIVTALYVGTLALSRALGDFEFKKSSKSAEEQMVTGESYLSIGGGGPTRVQIMEN